MRLWTRLLGTGGVGHHNPGGLPWSFHYMPCAGGRQPGETVWTQSLVPLCWSAWGAEIDPCVFNTHFWDQKKIINPVIIRIVKQRQSRKQ